MNPALASSPKCRSTRSELLKHAWVVLYPLLFSCLTVLSQAQPSTLTATLNNPAAAATDYFGYSVAMADNFIIIGAVLDDPGGTADAGTAYVFDATTGALLRTLNNPSPDTTDEFGISVAISGNLAVVGAYGDSPAGVSGAGTAYVFNAVTGAHISTLNNPDPAVGDTFGRSVAISGNVAVVGANADDPGGVPAAGSAYVFNASTGAHITTLSNPAAGAGDEFGTAVAISGNVAIVSAAFDDPSGVSDSGTAYVFDATTGAPIATLNNPTPAMDDEFGISVAIFGNNVVVGAYGDDPGEGTAYVFNASTGSLTATLNNPATEPNDNFAVSVAISGNIALVGASADNPGGIDNAGSAYAFDATTGAHLATLNNPSPAEFDTFGFAVAISGNRAVVGAYQDDPAGVSDSGSAYVFGSPVEPCSDYPLGSTLSNPALATGDLFGNSVAVAGNLAVVGAWKDDAGASDAGTAYVFDTMTGTFITTLTNPSPMFNDQFGVSVAVSGNVAVVGAWQDDTGATDAGTAYVFDAMTGTLTATLNNPAIEPNDNFGVSVAISGNLAVVGAYHDNPGGVNTAGTAYVFNAITGAHIATLNNPDAAVNDQFGNSVAISGNVAVVGAVHDDPSGVSNAGTAYVFNATTGALTATLNNPARIGNILSNPPKCNKSNEKALG